jgi:hypothetical protein
LTSELSIAERVRFLEHRGQRVLLVDASHCTPTQLLALADETQRRVALHPPNSLLTLADFTAAEVDKAAATRIKELLVFDRPYVKRSAWTGTETLPHVFYENFKTFSQRDFPRFPTREEALDWLVEP